MTPTPESKGRYWKDWEKMKTIVQSDHFKTNLMWMTFIGICGTVGLTLVGAVIALLINNRGGH